MEGNASFLTQLRYHIVVGVGFFADGWANGNIGLLVPMIGDVYFKDHKSSIPTDQSGLIKAAGKIGMLLGQLGFGFLGDALGRHNVYGKELIFSIFGILMCTLMPWKRLSHSGIVAWLVVGRIITGIGLGGDYPMSASVTLEKADPKARARSVMWTFFFAAFGNVSASIMYIILLAAFKNRIQHNVDNLDYVWRILMGLPLAPMLATVYWRFRMKETKPYLEYVAKASEEGAPQTRGIREQFRDFGVYFWNWRHAIALFSACSGWFLFDICEDGVQLNQSTVLASIGYGKGKTTYMTLWNTAVGNVIVQCAGYLPGFMIGNVLIDYIKRRNQQFYGTCLMGMLYAVWAGVYGKASSGGMLALFTLCQLVQLGGPNITTFLLPVELFPTRVRGTGHGIVAASGKLGAIITAYGFGSAEEAIGLKGVLGLFAGLSFVMAIFTGLVPETKGFTLDEIERNEPYKRPLLPWRKRNGENAIEEADVAGSDSSIEHVAVSNTEKGIQG